MRTNGSIKWQGEFIFISEVLIGEPVGIAETACGDWRVCFIDRRTYSEYSCSTAKREGVGVIGAGLRSLTLQTYSNVIPAKAGIQGNCTIARPGPPLSRG